MKLTFLGTRGEIDARTPRHRMHTSLLVTHCRRSVMIDCGTDWLAELAQVRPHAIVLTHAHPDHAWGLQNGAPCPVYAPQQAWDTLVEAAVKAVEDRRVIELRRPTEIEGIVFEAFPVEHSIRAPAVGYRVSAGKASIFYAPDLVYIPEREEALAGVKLYVGDGATLTRSFVRKRGDKLIGHAPVRTQLGWCGKSGVPRALFTHCGSEIVTGDEAALAAELDSLARERGVLAGIAHDGMALVIR